MTKFGEVIRALRLADELSTRELANKIGVNKTYVYGIEKNRVSPPSVKVLKRIHKAFRHRGITLEDLVELAWTVKAPALIHERVMARIKDNPLLAIRVTDPKVYIPGAPEKAGV